MAESVLSLSDKGATDGSAQRVRHIILLALAVSASYFLTSKLGFGFALQPGSISILWMPNSILLASLLLSPRRWWWLMLLAAFPAHLASELQSGVPVAMVLSWFVSNSFQALIGAYCITNLVPDGLRFDRFRDVMVFLILGAFTAPFLSSFLDIAFIKINGWGNTSFWESWRIRFLSNVLATLTLVPFVVVWGTTSAKALVQINFRRYVEACLLLTGLLLVAYVAFTTQRSIADRTPSLLYWPLPFVLWAAVRFGPHGVSTSLLVVMFLAIFGATHGQGPFVGSSSVDNALSIQWFLIVMAIPLMTLSAVIEERRRAVQAARENEDRLKQTEMRLARTEAFSLVMVTHLGLDGRFLKVPPTLCDLVGYSEAELLSLRFHDITHPDDVQHNWNQCQRLVRGEIRSFDLEKRYIRKDGHIVWVDLNCSIVEDDHGRPVHFLNYIRDMTDRKRAEQALRESNARNQAILRALPDMMFLQSKDGTYLDYYSSDKQTLLLPPELFMQKRVHDVLPKELADRVMACITRLQEGAESQTLEYSLEIGGEQRHYEARMVSAEGDKALSIVRDVTDARRAADFRLHSEMKLRESNQQIRALAGRLITAQESERRRISLLLHDDVSQKIAALGVGVSKLKRKFSTSNHEITAELDQVGLHLQDLTSQIRHLSHQLHPDVLEHVGLVTALESHVSDVRREERLNVSFKSSVSTEPLAVDLSICLYHVAFEALRNVSKHSAATAASISLAEENGYVTLQVSDTGRGFDVEKAKHGSGIGLMSAEERVKLLGGTFEIRSTPQVGTTVRARVPLAR